MAGGTLVQELGPVLVAGHHERRQVAESSANVRLDGDRMTADPTTVTPVTFRVRISSLTTFLDYDRTEGPKDRRTYGPGRPCSLGSRKTGSPWLEHRAVFELVSQGCFGLLNGVTERCDMHSTTKHLEGSIDSGTGDARRPFAKRSGAVAPSSSPTGNRYLRRGVVVMWARDHFMTKVVVNQGKSGGYSSVASLTEARDRWEISCHVNEFRSDRQLTRCSRARFLFLD
jgi:hypothetical protein